MAGQRSRLSIEKELTATLEAAHQRKQLARRAYESAIRKATAAPRPEGLQEMKNAAMEHRLSHDAYEHALKRFTDFTSNGIVPDDL